MGQCASHLFLRIDMIDSLDDDLDLYVRWSGLLGVCDMMLQLSVAVIDGGARLRGGKIQRRRHSTRTCRSAAQ